MTPEQYYGCTCALAFPKTKQHLALLISSWFVFMGHTAAVILISGCFMNRLKFLIEALELLIPELVQECQRVPPKLYVVEGNNSINRLKQQFYCCFSKLQVIYSMIRVNCTLFLLNNSESQYLKLDNKNR